MAIDPICGMTVDEATAKWTATVGGETFYFCSPGCKARFEAETHSTQHTAPSTFTCPMHPEIVRDAPGFCPICGMALEPRVATLEEDNSELVDMKRRFWICVALSLPLLLLSMSEMLPGDPVRNAIGPQFINWISLVLATPVVLWGGWPFFV